MGGGRDPRPLGGTKTAAIDDGTSNRQASPAPVPLGVHRDYQPWESSSRRMLHELKLNPDPDRDAARRVWSQIPESFRPPLEDSWSFLGFSLARSSTILLLPTMSFQATPWERAFGFTFASNNQKSQPIVNAKNEVVGHIASFRADQILVPRIFRDIRLSDAVVSGVPAFVTKENPDWNFWAEPPPQTMNEVVVTPSGEVIAVLSAQGYDGVTSQSSWEYFLTVVSLVDGYILVRAAASAAGRAALSRVNKWLGERAAVALERERLQALAHAPTQPAAAFARTEPPEAFARTQPPEALADTVPGSPGITLNTGDFAAASATSEARKRFMAFQAEVGAEIDAARAARGILAEGKAWMKELAEIYKRVEQKHYPGGIHLD